MTQTPQAIPETQYAVQFVGRGRMKLNVAKKVIPPGPHQVLARVQAVGLCFSDLKLLKQFDTHARKSAVLSGIDPAALAEMPNYAPDAEPTVPGHEAVCEIVAVGRKVARHKVGERVLVQTNYYWLRTAKLNASFGYCFEGALQEYVLMDERVIITPDGERYLIPVGRHLSRAAVGLVEPWACVEHSYARPERRTIKPGGRLLVVADDGHAQRGLEQAFSPQGPPEEITEAAPDEIPPLNDHAYDDIVYFGAEAAAVEALCDKLDSCGILNVVTAGRKLGRPVSLDVGRLHYGMIRWTGTASDGAAEAYGHIPATGEIRDGERLIVVGAGGPMGQMHVIRAASGEHPGVSIVASDLDDTRLASVKAKAGALAKDNGVELRLVNLRAETLDQKFSYAALMAPVPELVAQAVTDSDDGCRINVFAGIPAGTRTEIDLDTYIANRCWAFGTSGSVLSDMKAVLEKVTAGRLDTDRSVDAVCGINAACEGIEAVKNRTIAGKIVVYPSLHDTPLTVLSELGERYPTVAEKLAGGVWTKAAEDELLRVAQ